MKRDYASSFLLTRIKARLLQQLREQLRKEALEAQELERVKAVERAMAARKRAE